MHTFIQEANLDCRFIDAVCFLAFTHFVQCYSRLVVSLLGFLLGFLFGWLVAERVRIGLFLGESKLFHIISYQETIILFSHIFQAKCLRFLTWRIKRSNRSMYVYQGQKVRRNSPRTRPSFGSVCRTTKQVSAFPSGLRPNSATRQESQIL